ncbi:MAG: hypothetical protein V3U75_02730 [Methylococcaceae bacterium]
MLKLAFLASLLCSIGDTLAENFYLERVMNLPLDAKTLAESEKKIKEHKNIKIRDDIDVPPFHKRKTGTDPLANTFCTTCHLSPPHTKSLRKRSFLNMHTRYVACESCHLRPEDVKMKFVWVDYDKEQTVDGQPGLFRTVNKSKKQKIVDQTKPKENKAKTRPNVRIAPFHQGQPALILQSNDFAKDTANIWKNGSLQEKVKRRAKIHLPLEKEGPPCQDCHQSEKPMLNLPDLGATKSQAAKIQHHTIPQFFQRYTDDEQQIKIESLLK